MTIPTASAEGLGLGEVQREAGRLAVPREMSGFFGHLQPCLANWSTKYCLGAFLQ